MAATVLNQMGLDLPVGKPLLWIVPIYQFMALGLLAAGGVFLAIVNH